MNHTSSQSIGESDRGYFGWRVVIGSVVGLAFSPGPIALVLVGAMTPLLMQRYGWSLEQIMFGITLQSLLGLAAAPIVGRLVDRFGVRNILFPAILSTAICVLLFGYAATTLASFYTISIVFGLLSAGGSSLTYNKLLTAWFDRKRGLAIGIGSAGLGLGYMTLPLIIAFGLTHYDLEGAVLLVAGIILLFPFAINLLTARDPARTIAYSAVPNIGEGATVRDAVTSAVFWIVAAAAFIVSVISTGLVPQFANMAKDLGYTTGEGALIAAIFGAATLLGRLVVGWLFDHYFAPKVVLLFFLLATVGYLVAASVNASELSWHILAAATILMGLGFGAESDLIAYLASRYFGQRNFGSIYGLLLAIFILGVALGPLLYAALREWTGSYTLVFLICAGASAVSALLMLFLPPFPAPLRRETAAAGTT